MLIVDGRRRATANDVAGDRGLEEDQYHDRKGCLQKSDNAGSSAESIRRGMTRVLEMAVDLVSCQLVREPLRR